MEFTLRQQEFIELIRAQKCVEAVFHARKYFVSLTPQQLIDVQKSMVLLVYAKSSEASSHVNKYLGSLNKTNLFIFLLGFIKRK